MLGTHEGICLINVHCQACNTKYLIGVVLDKDDLDNIAELKDKLPFTEMASFMDSEELTADEVIDMHSFLENFDGNFSQLFAHEQS